ncbi:LDL receptor wingless signaling/trafficking chaperone [Carex rostrata]
MRRTLVVLFFISILVASEGYKRKRVAIPDDLDDVVDDEDDEAWEQWGLKKSGSRPDKNLPPPDFSKMDPSKIQELMKQHTGPSYGFVKLKFGVSRSKEDVQNIATKWSKMLKAGSIDVRFMAVDLKTFMFTMEKGQDLEELKEFILSQSDAYEVKIGDQTYRRPGDPSLDQVIERLRREKHTSDKSYNNEL